MENWSNGVVIGGVMGDEEEDNIAYVIE
jgi:hypothetical protein